MMRTRSLQKLGATTCRCIALRGTNSSSRCHPRLFAVAPSPLQWAQPIPRRWQSSTKKSKAKKREDVVGNNRHYQFLTPGFQPTAILGDDAGFYDGSTFYKGVPPDTLPILDVSVILSPGRFCKKSSWFTSHDRHKGTKSGVDAADRLVHARRALAELVQNELQVSHQAESSNSNNNYNEKEAMGKRKIYAIKGHGVPVGLLRELLDVAKDWLRHCPQQQTLSTAQTTTSASPSLQISFTNIPGSTFLDQSQIKMMNSHGICSTLPSLPREWESDLEMYMVVMDRMGSRLASLAMAPFSSPDDYFDYDTKIVKVDSHLSGNDEHENSSGPGSFVIPAHLKQWDVTIMKGESLPSSLLPRCNGRDGTNRGRQEKSMNDMPHLTLEWVMEKSINDGKCWNVILRLQDDGPFKKDGIRLIEPVSFVFEGEYVAPK